MIIFNQFSSRFYNVVSVSSVLLGGCATKVDLVPGPVASESNIVTPVVRVISEVYSEHGGAAKYVPEKQYMLALRPPVEGEYVKLDVLDKKQGQIKEFKVPAPKRYASETISKSVVVFFTFNNSTLGAESKLIIKKIVSSGFSISSVSVQGFADKKGSSEANLKLSKARADAVVTALLEAGIPSEKITSDGFGSDSPIDDNNSLSGRSRNRRVEINIIGEEQTVK